MKTPITPHSTAADAAAFIQQLRRGDFARELAESAAEAVKKVRDTGRPATIAISLKFTPESEGEMVHITDDINLKIPKAKKGKSVFFTTEEGGLSRTDPGQAEFTFRSVEVGETREVVDDGEIKSVAK